jgi:hypothetical protein
MSELWALVDPPARALGPRTPAPAINFEGRLLDAALSANVRYWKAKGTLPSDVWVEVSERERRTLIQAHPGRVDFTRFRGRCFAVYLP